jgi:hypothetical protein
MNTLKNWWLQILAVAGLILDLGFDALNPLILAVGVPEKWIVIIKLLFGLAIMLKSKVQLPTQNADKLQGKVDALIGGSKPPIDKDEK